MRFSRRGGHLIARRAEFKLTKRIVFAAAIVLATSVAAGADGLLIEVHNDPEKALSDGAQSLFPQQFEQLMKELRMIAPAVGRKVV